MENIIKQIIDMGMGNVMDKRRDPLILADEIYQQDTKDQRELEDRYDMLALTTEQRRIIDDYIACIFSTNCRVSDISYMVGIRDAILFLNQVGLLKGNATENGGN